MTDARTIAEPQYDGPTDVKETVAYLKRLDHLKAINAELVEALRGLEGWGRVFVEKTPISAETLWREFPRALDKASAVLAKAKGAAA